MNMQLITVELATAALALILLVFGLIAPKDQSKGIGYVAVLGLLVIIGIAWVMRSVEGWAFGEMYRVDTMSAFFKLLFLVSGTLVCGMSLKFTEKLGYNDGEYYALIVATLLGMMVLASATDFITLFMGLELMTISFVILTAYKKGDKKSSEAGIKYILLSAMSSAVLLFGMSLVFGLTGTVEYAGLTGLLSGEIPSMLIVAAVMIIAGFAFKLSLVPFHMWAPDIYEGAPTPVTALLSTGSKIAALAAFIRFITVVQPDAGGPIGVLLIILSVMTILFGNFVAIPQTNIKRMLAFSSIAHAGYLMLGLLAFNDIGIAAMLYYSAVYVFANVGVFAAITAFGNQTGSEEIRDFTGMWKRSPFIATVMLVSLLSLAGIPPLAGFYGKFYIFVAIINEGYIWLAFLAIMMSMVSVYYYLIVAKVMFIGDPMDETPIKSSGSAKVVMVIATLVTVLLGVYQDPLTNMVGAIAKAFLGL